MLTCHLHCSAIRRRSAQACKCGSVAVSCMDVSGSVLACAVQALTPAMEGWKKRIGRIATNFEAANKDTIQPQQQARSGQQASLTSCCIMTLFRRTKSSYWTHLPGSHFTHCRRASRLCQTNVADVIAGRDKSIILGRVRKGEAGSGVRQSVQPALRLDELPRGR
jgi:hypothetical protein